ncbi:MAG: hypothetical protein HQL74_15615 [Magnetococcales bacterium]|nr:hypothetical protein [Magnetococcales bacterium]
MPHLDQFVHAPVANFCLASDAGQLGIQKFVAPFPIDIVMRNRQEKGQKVLEVGLQNLFPGDVEGIFLGFFMIF